MLHFFCYNFLGQTKPLNVFVMSKTKTQRCYRGSDRAIIYLPSCEEVWRKDTGVGDRVDLGERDAMGVSDLGEA